MSNLTKVQQQFSVQLALCYLCAITLQMLSTQEEVLVAVVRDQRLRQLSEVKLQQ